MSSELLQQAYRLIRDGNKPEAVRLLTPIVRAEPLNADAWWLLANALDNPDQQRRALEQVLKLRPNDDAARRMYERFPSNITPTNNPAVKRTAKTRPVLAPAPEFRETGEDENILDTYDPMLGEQRPSRSSSGSSGRRRNPLTTCLAIIGALVVISCIGCLAVTAFGVPVLGNVVQDIMLTYTSEPALATLASGLATLGAPQFQQTLGAAIQSGVTQIAPQSAATLAVPPSSASMPSDLVGRGSITKGQTVNQTVDTFRDDAWTFSADAGEHVVIELTANDPALDPHLYLYNGSRALVAENDDVSDSNNNSRIEITLTDAGKYTIRVSRFNGGGAYTLSLN